MDGSGLPVLGHPASALSITTLPKGVLNEQMNVCVISLHQVLLRLIELELSTLKGPSNIFSPG